MSVTVLPSFPAPTWEALRLLLDSLKGVSREFQVDLVDGKFVPLLSWPFTDGGLVDDLTALLAYAEDYELALDCMVAKPEQHLDRLVSVGAKRLIVHLGSTNEYERIAKAVRNADMMYGIAATNDVPLAELTGRAKEADYVQIMGIKKVGQQGQPFDERTFDTISRLRKQFPDLEIAVDGAVNEKTIKFLVAAGANRLAPGSAISQAKDPVAAYKQLVKLANT